jgi:hypothetical protein
LPLMVGEAGCVVAVEQWATTPTGPGVDDKVRSSHQPLATRRRVYLHFLTNQSLVTLADGDKRSAAQP